MGAGLAASQPCSLQPAACSRRPAPTPPPPPRHMPTPRHIWQVLSHEAPAIRPINVRRELGLLCEASLAHEKKALLQLKP